MVEPVIAGVDPGTTAGYCILDLRGEKIKIGSSKELNTDAIIRLLVKHGKPILIGCDKNPPPSAVERISKKTGAKLIFPKKDLLILEKKELIKGIETKNSHEDDALASAVFAYKSAKGLFSRVDSFLKPRKMEALSSKIKELLIKRDDLSISKALTLLTKKEEVQEIKEPEKKSVPPEITRLKERIKSLEKENLILRKKSSALNKQLSEIEKKDSQLEAMLKKKKTVRTEKETAKLLMYKEQRLHNQEKIITKSRKKEKKLRKRIKKVKLFLEESKGKVLIKKIENLGWETISKLKIEEGDVLLVEKISNYSEKSINDIKKKVMFIITETPNNRRLSQEFILIDKNKLNLNETEGFALVEPEQLEKEKGKKNILKSILSEYREERAKNKKE